MQTYRNRQLQPGKNCVVGHGDTIITPCGHKYSIDFEAVAGSGRRFQFVYLGKDVDVTQIPLHNGSIGESRSPALAGQ